jgi:putative addiction module component (TIGR02574 family)
MAKVVDELKSKLAALTPSDRAELAHFLIESLEESSDADAAWNAELDQRAVEIRSGTVVGKPAAQVFAELRETHS